MSSSVFKMHEMDNDLVEELLTHILPKSWHGKLDRMEAEKLLEEKKIGTYLFRLDPLGIIYMSGVNSHGHFEHSRIEKHDTMWLGVQGEPYLRKNVNELPHLCLHLEADECTPL